MPIASRTREGMPLQCPICGKIALLEPCYPGGDSVCLSCSQLMRLFCERVCANLGVNLNPSVFDWLFRDKASVDSLDFVEVVIELEEATGIMIPEVVASRFLTVRDVIEYIRRRQEDKPNGPAL